MKESFEVKKPSIIESVENQVALARKLEAVYENRPEIDSFVGCMKGTRFENEYTDEAIKRDKEYVEKTRKSIDESNSSFGRENLDSIERGFQLSEMMQAMVVDRMNNNWFADCKAIMTTDYDDLSVGIDAVMKHEKGTYLGASFDFTVTSQEKRVYEKLKTVWNKTVKDGKIPTVKYFRDPDTKEQKSLLVPKFIIGATKKDVEDLAGAYLSDDTETLQNHPFKYVMLLQIEEQLQTALDYYELKNNEGSLRFAKQQYENIQKTIRSIKKEVHLDEQMKNLDLYEYSKTSIALEMMRRFRMMRDRE